ncbi:hypothetical protein [Mesorhizobium sp. M0217]|uniref:hypothetical protein n=1 Tax=unclassified Mesorhizobium TaxID=325217 RepID=UPI00333D2C72
MAKRDPIVDLTMFVMRRVGADDDETGTGLLVTPRLVMTALHVVCPFGPGRVVPAHHSLRLYVRFEIASRSVHDAPRSVAKFYPARLVWPPAGTPAGVDSRDIALLALDNEGLEEGEPGYLPQNSVDDARDLIERYNLEDATKRIRLGVAGNGPPQAKFIGYPVGGDIVLRDVLKAIGQEGIPAAVPFSGTIPQAVPTAAGLIFLNVLQVWLPTPEVQHPYAGLSGASVYRMDDAAGCAEVYGVLNRVLSEKAAQGLLTIAPIPASAGFAALVPKPPALADEEDPFQRARDVIHRLDRSVPVQIYLDGFRNKRPRSYLYVFVTTHWDGPTALCRRLQEVSSEDKEPIFDIRTFASAPPSITIQSMNGPTDCDRLLAKLAKGIGARAPGEDSAQPSIADRLASGAGPRLLLFDVDEARLFDEDTGERLEGAVATLRQLMQEIAGWAKQEPKPPSGISFERDNPVVAVLTVYVSSRETRQAFKQANVLVERAIALFQKECPPPEGMHCEVYNQPLDVISFDDFRDWCTQQFRTVNFSSTLGNAMEPPFTGGELRFDFIQKSLSALK